jgi:hypothetical protein
MVQGSSKARFCYLTERQLRLFSRVLWTTLKSPLCLSGGMADTRDLKSLALYERAGSSPASGTYWGIVQRLGRRSLEPPI